MSSSYNDLKEALAGTGIEAAAGAARSSRPPPPGRLGDGGIVGAAGLSPTLAAVRAGSRIALANKECLVCGGRHFHAEVARARTELCRSIPSIRRLPGDGRRAAPRRIERIVLTASGGPFRTWSRGRDMRRHAGAGARASQLVDGAEDHHQLGDPDEQGARADRGLSSVRSSRPARGGRCIRSHRPCAGRLSRRLDAGAARQPRHAHADRLQPGLARAHRTAPTARLDLARDRHARPSRRPDQARFPALRMAREALRAGGSASTVLNAANEVAVEAFLGGAIGFLEIGRTGRGDTRSRGARCGLATPTASTRCSPSTRKARAVGSASAQCTAGRGALGSPRHLG